MSKPTLQKSHSLTNVLGNAARRMYSSPPTSPLSPKARDHDIVRDYDFSFESLYDIDECRLIFQQFLEGSQNADPLLFLQAVEDFQVLRSTKNRYESAKLIVKRFIKSESENEINLSNMMRTSILESYKRCDEENMTSDFFTEAYMTVFMELKHDCFANFVNSQPFKSYVSSSVDSDPDFLRKVATRKPQNDFSDASIASTNNDELSGDEEDEECDPDLLTTNGTESGLRALFDLTPFFTESHVELYKRELERSATWKKLKLKSKLPGREICVSRSTKIKIDGKKRKVRKVRECGILPFSVDEVFYTYVDSKYIAAPEPLLKKVDFVQHHSRESKANSGQYATSVLHFHCQMAFPLSNRDFIVANTALREDKGYLVLRKSADCTLVDKQNGVTRGHLATALHLERLDAQATRYTHIGFVDMGGWMSSRTWKALAKNRESSFHVGLERACMDRHKRYIKKFDDVIRPPKESNYLYNCYLDNSK